MKRFRISCVAMLNCFYDLNHRPGFRLIEGLLYRSPFYNPSYQSVLSSIIESEERPFVFSTPRLPQSQDIHLKIPFNSSAIDELFEMRHARKSFGYIKEVLGFPSEQDDLFKTFLMEAGPEKKPTYDGDS